MTHGVASALEKPGEFTWDRTWEDEGICKDSLKSQGFSRGLKKSHFGLLRLFRSRRLSGYC